MSTKKLATTGVAAHLIGDETLHHFFGMGIDAKSWLENGTVKYDMVNAADLIIIDEFSLLESNLSMQSTDFFARWHLPKTISTSHLEERISY